MMKWIVKSRTSLNGRAANYDATKAYKKIPLPQVSFWKKSDGGNLLFTIMFERSTSYSVFRSRDLELLLKSPRTHQNAPKQSFLFPESSKNLRLAENN